jgi:hypothetical protein
LRAPERRDLAIDRRRRPAGAAERRRERHRAVAVAQPIERRQRIALRGGRGDLVDVTAGLEPAPDHHAEHEHQAGHDGATEEQVEDLAPVEADLDLVLVQLAIGSSHRGMLLP